MLLDRCLQRLPNIAPTLGLNVSCFFGALNMLKTDVDVTYMAVWPGAELGRRW